MTFSNLKKINKFLGDLINRKKIVFKDDIKLEKVFHFADLLDNPQKNLKVIHVAGTSGKGSTAFILSKILEGQGFKVGLTTSPHLKDVRERVQINNKILDEKSFVNYFNSILPAIQKVEKPEFGGPTYFETLTLLALKIFEKEKVDYAILEVGMGGRLDATNICNNENKICLINNIGMDHSKSLGNSLQKIAFEKAGIIYPKNQVFKTFQTAEINQVFEAVAKQKNASLEFVKTSPNPKGQHIIPPNPPYEGGNLEFNSFRTSLVGDFQKLNLNLALNCLNFLSVRDGFKIDEKSLQNTLLNLSFPGRFEVFSLKNSSKKIIFDGAHNFQKISTFLDSLKKEFPKQRFNFVVGLKKGKDYKRFLRKIVNFEGVQKVYLTKINQEKNPSVESISILEMKNYLAKILEKSSVEKQKIKILSVEKIEDILEKEIPEEENNLAIVGSLYFYNSLEI